MDVNAKAYAMERGDGQHELFQGRLQLRGDKRQREQRLWRWCLIQAGRQARTAARRGQWVGPRHVQRMAKRRWAVLNFNGGSNNE